ncbi:related to FAD1 |nr:related to FAD1 \
MPPNSSTLSSSSSTPSPSPEWLKSIDAVYTLFEDPVVSKQFPSLSTKVAAAVRLCEIVISQVGQQHCALSFNGGKDCTVLVHILSSVLRRLNCSASSASSDSSCLLPSIPSLYIACPSPFRTVEKFIGFCVSPVHGYNLNLVSVQGDMKQAIRTYLDGEGSHSLGLQAHKKDGRQKPRDIRAIFVGTRRDDPHGPQLSPRSWTDQDWPRVERIHPILDWTYSDVWQFLRCPHLGTAQETDSALGVARHQLAKECGVAGGGSEGVPYCLLYDQGYTSLGSTFNTFPNPELRIETEQGKQGEQGEQGEQEVEVGDGTARGRWKPAYMLKDATLERAGRVENPQHAKASQI